MAVQKTGSKSTKFAFKPVLMFVLIMLVTAVIGNQLFRNLREGIKQEAQRNIVAVGKLKANQISDWLGYRFGEGRIISDNSFFARDATSWMQDGACDEAKRKLLVARLEAFLNGHHFRSIVLFDTSGRAVLNAGEPIIDGPETAAEARKTIASGEFRFIDLHRHKDDAAPADLGFMVPLRAGDAVFGAIYLAEDPAQYLYPLVHYWPDDNVTTETHLVRKDGDDVLFLDQLRYRPEPPLHFRMPLNTPRLSAAVALRGQQGLLENTRDYRGNSVLAYATSISGTPWMLISKIDEDDAYRMVNQMQQVANILAIFIFVLIGAWFWQWRRSVHAQMEQTVLKERVRADALQMEGERRFRTVFEHNALPMVRTSLQGEFIEVNNAWCNLFGYSREDVLSRRLTWQQITHPDDIEPCASLVKQMLAGEIDDFNLEKRYNRKDGKELWGAVQMTLVRDEQEAPEFIITTIQDITERKQSEQSITFMAYHDKLTGLPNRALLFDRLSHAMAQAHRNARSLAVLFVDLDGFKEVNDKYGHEAGDAVLRMATQRFLACVRASDTVARFGGDEFTIILGNLDKPQQAKSVAEKILRAFAQNMTLPNGFECNVKASIGISIYPEHGSTVDNLITAADQAMYESKRRGKNTFSFFQEKELFKEGLPWLEFDDSYLLGVEELDEQHRNMWYLGNRLNEAVKHKESLPSLMLILNELLLAITHHFETESRYMTDYHYPEQHEHEEEHARLLSDARRFKDQFTEGREPLVLQSVKDWLVGHIAFSDKRMAKYLTGKGAH